MVPPRNISGDPVRKAEKGSVVLPEDDAQRVPQDLLPSPCGCVAH